MKAVPIILCGLTASIAFKANFFNIGGEGQFYSGAMAAAWVGLTVGYTSPLIGIPLAMVAGVAGGIAWIAVPAFLKLRLGVNEIFTTLMLNFVAIFLNDYLVSGPLLQPGGILPRTAIISSSVWLPDLNSVTNLSSGIIVAVLAVLALQFVMNSTTLGLKIRVIGANDRAARYAGIEVGKTLRTAIILSGALAGLAGMIEVCGNFHFMIDGISPFPIGYGYIGIWVALVGRLNPIGVLISSFFFAILIVGGSVMQLNAGVPAAIVYVIQGLTVLFIIGGTVLNRRRS
jgi:simple sugar transport system permease protein